MDGVGIWFDIAAQTKQQGQWKNGKRLKWLG
jgi:hypothetical protein